MHNKPCTKILVIAAHLGLLPLLGSCATKEDVHLATKIQAVKHPEGCAKIECAALEVLLKQRAKRTNSPTMLALLVQYPNSPCIMRLTEKPFDSRIQTVAVSSLNLSSKGRLHRKGDNLPLDGYLSIVDIRTPAKGLAEVSASDGHGHVILRLAKGSNGWKGEAQEFVYE